MSWHYLPVYRDIRGERIFTVCEVYIDKQGRLTMWTESPAMTPSGETIDELIADLGHMLKDARGYEPVAFEDLKVGMTFKTK